MLITTFSHLGYISIMFVIFYLYFKVISLNLKNIHSQAWLQTNFNKFQNLPIIFKHRNSI